VADTFYTPFFPETGLLMSGVEVQGHIIHTLLQGSWIQELNLRVKLGIYLVTILLFSLLTARLSPSNALVALTGFIFLISGLSFLFFWKGNLWVPPPLLSIGIVFVFLGQVFTQFLLESRERRWLRHAFSHYVSPSLVEAILTNPEQLKLGGEERDVTVLFADLVGFSTLSEERSPEGVIRCLYDYFSAMTDVILAFQGTIDKYIGDALMAFWGAPLPQENHASLACHAALEMQRALHQLQKTWQSQGWPLLSARVGMHSGSVIAGNVGSRTRFNYTVMGPTVNLAYRLEEVNRHYGTEIIISETTYQRLGNGFLVRELDQVQVKGRGQPVTLFELLGPFPSKGMPTWIESFNCGRIAYLKREWHQAVNYFQKVLDLHENDPPTKLYLKRCLQYSHNPPPISWNGVTILDKK
jgi:adenylate cyclase